MSENAEKNLSREEVLLEVRELVQAAVGRLKALGPEHERVGWLLEDALCYLDEIGMSEVVLPVSDTDTTHQDNEVEDAVNAETN